MRRRVTVEQHRRQVATIDHPVRGRSRSRERGEGRVQFHRGRQLRTHPAGLQAAGPPGDARHPHAALPRGALVAAQRPVRATVGTVERAVVAGEHHQRVLVQTQLAERSEDDLGRPVDRGDRRAVATVPRRRGEAVLDVDRQVDVQVRQVHEELAVPVRADEVHDLGHVPAGQRRLVGLLVDHTIVLEQRQRRVARLLAVRGLWCADLTSHVVAVGQPQVAVEPVVGRQELGLVTAVPLADHERRVAGIRQQSPQADLGVGQPDGLSGEEHGQALERAEADAWRVAAGQQRPARGRAHR